MSVTQNYQPPVNSISLNFGDCVIPGMGSKTKIMLDARPGSIMSVELVLMEFVLILVSLCHRKKN